MILLVQQDEIVLDSKKSNFWNKNNLFSEDQPSPESTTFQSVEKKNFNSLKNEVLLDSEALSPQLPLPSPPQEVLIQSVPIQTLSLDKMKQPSRKPDLQDTFKINTLPVKFFKPQNFKPHIFDGASKTSEKELVKFIQNLMNQAKKEQEDLTINSIDNKHEIIHAKEYMTSYPKSNTISPLSTSTTTISTTTLEPSTPSVRVKPSSTSTTPAGTSSFTAPLLPFRTTLRTTTELTTTTTTTDGSASGVITRLLSEAAAPIAGLSAATLAYSAAAMLPVWLPAALAGRKRKSFDVNSDDLQNIQNFLEEKR